MKPAFCCSDYSKCLNPNVCMLQHATRLWYPPPTEHVFNVKGEPLNALRRARTGRAFRTFDALKCKSDELQSLDGQGLHSLLKLYAPNWWLKWFVFVFLLWTFVGENVSGGLAGFPPQPGVLTGGCLIVWKRGDFAWLVELIVQLLSTKKSLVKCVLCCLDICAILCRSVRCWANLLDGNLREVRESSYTEVKTRKCKINVRYFLLLPKFLCEPKKKESSAISSLKNNINFPCFNSIFRGFITWSFNNLS